jgi:hypothetical protein
MSNFRADCETHDHFPSKDLKASGNSVESFCLILGKIHMEIGVGSGYFHEASHVACNYLRESNKVKVKSIVHSLNCPPCEKRTQNVNRIMNNWRGIEKIQELGAHLVDKRSDCRNGNEKAFHQCESECDLLGRVSLEIVYCGKHKCTFFRVSFCSSVLISILIVIRRMLSDIFLLGCFPYSVKVFQIRIRILNLNGAQRRDSNQVSSHESLPAGGQMVQGC